MRLTHTALLWGSLAVFGAVAAGRALLELRVTAGLALDALVPVLAGLTVLGAALLAMRDPERFAPDPPWIAYVAAAGTLLYLVTLAL